MIDAMDKKYIFQEHSMNRWLGLLKMLSILSNIMLSTILKKIYKKKGYEYWNAYLQSYIAEMESHPMHYVLIKGIDVRQDEEEQNNKFLGIYDGLARLEDAYVVAVQKLEEQHKNMTGLLGDKVDYIVKHEK